jgi:hypothetical protein
VVETAVAVKLLGAIGGPDAGVGVAVGVAVAVAVGDGVPVGVGVGLGVVLLIWTILATEGTPAEFKINSM